MWMHTSGCNQPLLAVAAPTWRREALAGMRTGMNDDPMIAGYDEEC
jgi:hypothetical protein